MTRRLRDSVTWPASSSTTRPSATQCQDAACGQPLVQATNGRPKLYCDATCRKNAARARDWAAWSQARAAWREREDWRRREHTMHATRWDLAPYLPVEPWQQAALDAGWTPPGGVAWFWENVGKHSPRPEPYQTPQDDPEPAAPHAPRTGKKGQGW